MVQKNPNRYEWRMPLELLFLGQERYEVTRVVSLLSARDPCGQGWQDGDPFNLNGNATIAPRPPIAAPLPGTVVSGTPPSRRRPTKPTEGPTAAKESNSGKSKKKKHQKGG
ncbi:hypothetical protein Fmac_010414 [Flemingia macrophylla]|uniref:Uncharacterized protein n=1 Tax=Flemingia macrophylla TaxID=520843 RepID=A0ABD1MJH8_9FABA